MSIYCLGELYQESFCATASGHRAPSKLCGKVHVLASQKSVLYNLVHESSYPIAVKHGIFPNAVGKQWHTTMLAIYNARDDKNALPVTTLESMP